MVGARAGFAQSDSSSGDRAGYGDSGQSGDAGSMAEAANAPAARSAAGGGSGFSVGFAAGGRPLRGAAGGILLFRLLL